MNLSRIFICCKARTINNNKLTKHICCANIENIGCINLKWKIYKKKKEGILL